MSLRKRKFIGELTKKDLYKKLIAGGIIISILLAVWMFLPGVIDTLFGGSRGHFDTHDPLPPPGGPYNLDPIPFEPRIVIDPTKITLDLLEMLRDLLDPQNIDIEGDFSDFNITNFDIPLFYINDVGPVVGAPGYHESMRQNTYDTMAADGTRWTRSKTVMLPVNDRITNFTVPYTTSSCREVTFIMNSTETINLRIPVFPYTPKYVNDSASFIGSFGTNPIPDDDVLYNDTYEGLEVRAYGLPSYSEAVNFSYRVVNDYSMSLGREGDYRDGFGIYNSLTPAAANLTSAFTNYLQIPGVGSSRDLAPYLNSHSQFAAAYTNLSAMYNKASSPTHEILAGIVTYLYATYDVFTTFPERPGDGQDMVEWFLSRPKTTFPNAGGTPYDFAAAFTMLARAFDIPARLVTGYYDWDGDNVMTLSNVYAWAEAYLPESNPSDNHWINYEFVPQFNSTQMLPVVQDIIVIDNPANGEIFLSPTGLPLNLRMFTNATINDITYSVDGGAPISVISSGLTFLGYPGAWCLNDTFNVTSPGVHTIQAFMQTTNGSVTSQTNTFIVNQETGYFVSVNSPVNNSVINTTTIILDYTAVNSSAITGASYSVFYTNNGTPAILNAPIPPMPSQVWPFMLAVNGTFSLVITIITELGIFTSLSTFGSVLFSRYPPDLLPDASFYPLPSTVVPGQPVTFVHSGSNGNGNATYQWDFGDGTPNSTQENPTHFYSTPGVYNVTLTVTDADGDVSTITWTYAVTVVPNTIPDPVVVVNATHITPGQSIWFNHTGSPGDPPYIRSWIFGDGFSAGNATPVVHQYLTEGNYTAYLTITDGNNDTRTSVPINIVVSWNLYPTAWFRVNGSSTPMFISSGDSVQFTHTGSNGDTPTTTWQWNFGDGSPNATVENPLHMYNATGSHTVTLTVTDNNGDQDIYRWVGCINVNVYVTELTVDFTPKYVEIFQNITISGNLRYINGTGIGGQSISLRIEYWLGATLQAFNTTVAVTAAGTGFFQATIQVLTSSDLIRVIANFAGTPVLLASTAQVVG